MKVRLVFFALIMMLCAGFSACSSRSPETLKNDADQKAVKVVALLPVENQTGDVRASKMLRLKISDELRFKGYPQVAIEVIDEGLAALAGGKEAGKNDAVSPAFIRETLGADAAMYCCLMESKAAKKNILYAGHRVGPVRTAQHGNGRNPVERAGQIHRQKF